MYQELGGYVGYQRTPVRELQEVRISIIAEMTVRAEQEQEARQKQEELERKSERMSQERRR